MSNAVRFELKIEEQDKEIILKASALAGMTMATFVRTAAQEKARMLLDRESKITLSQRDFEALTQSLDQAFAPNAALQKAIQAAKSVGRA